MSEVKDRPAEAAKSQDKPQEKRAVLLSTERFQLAEHARQDWVVNAAEGTTVEDVLSPQYWALVAPHIKPYDRIEVRLETGEWMLDLVALNTDRTWASVHLLHRYDLTPAAEAQTPEDRFAVVWAGPQHKFRVVRKADSAVLSSGHDTKVVAQAWMRNYEQTIDRPV